VSVKVKDFPHETCFTLLDTYLFVTSISYCPCKATWYTQITPSYFISLLLPFFFLFVSFFCLQIILPSSFILYNTPEAAVTGQPHTFITAIWGKVSQSVSLSTCRKSGRCTDDFLGRPELPIKQLYYENTQIDFPCKLIQRRNMQCKKTAIIQRHI